MVLPPEDKEWVELLVKNIVGEVSVQLSDRLGEGLKELSDSLHRHVGERIEAQAERCTMKTEIGRWKAAAILLGVAATGGLTGGVATKLLLMLGG